MGGCGKHEGGSFDVAEKDCCGGGDCSGGGCGGGEGGCGGCGGEGGKEKVLGPDVLEYGDYIINLLYNGEFCMVVNTDGSLVKKGEANSGKTITTVACVTYLSQAEKDYGVDPEAIVFLSKELEKRYGILRMMMQERANKLDAQLAEWQSYYGEIINRTLGLKDGKDEGLEGGEEKVGEVNAGDKEYLDSVELAKNAMEEALKKR